MFLVFALCWGFGAHLRSEARETMFNSIRIKMQQFCTNAFSDYNSPFEFFFDFEKEELVKWSFFITNPKYGSPCSPLTGRPEPDAPVHQHPPQHFHEEDLRNLPVFE